jgi:hypothetical protein
MWTTAGVHHVIGLPPRQRNDLHVPLPGVPDGHQWLQGGRLYLDSLRIRPPLAKQRWPDSTGSHDPTRLPGQRIAAGPDRAGSGRVGVS